MGKIYLAEKLELEGLGAHFVTCATASSTAAKTVDKTGFKLEKGAWVSVQFKYTNTVNSPTLNVNGTGAKAIYYKDTPVKSGCLLAGAIYLLIYDGQYWRISNNNTDLEDALNAADVAGLKAQMGKLSFGTSGTAGWRNEQSMEEWSSSAFSFSPYNKTYKNMLMRITINGTGSDTYERKLVLSTTKSFTNGVVFSCEGTSVDNEYNINIANLTGTYYWGVKGSCNGVFDESITTGNQYPFDLYFTINPTKLTK